MKKPDGFQTISVDTPARGGSVNVLRMERGKPSASGTKGYRAYELVAYLSYSRSGPRVVQIKKWVMQVYANGSDGPAFQIEDIPTLFNEFETTASAIGDIIMTLSVDNIIQNSADIVLTCETTGYEYTPVFLSFAIKLIGSVGDARNVDPRLVSF
jgi:hypothetical protein